MDISNERLTKNLNKMSLEELKETLGREVTLLKNSAVIAKLPDKGAAIKVFSEKIEKEIKFREDMQKLEESISRLTISEKHVQKLCDIEKVPGKERYKPFATLNTAKEVKPDSVAFKLMEDCSPTQKTTKLINLAESLEIQKQQNEKVKEEQLKARHEHALEKLEKDEESDDNGFESDSSRHLSDADDVEN